MSPKKKSRLDVLLVEKHLVQTRHQAQGLILAGRVTVDGTVESKSGTAVPPDALIEIAEPLRYVGRGGIKLEHALRTFNISPKGEICLDVGASTGGFTDCLLQHGALKVYAVDVGYAQLAWKLRNDPRVVVIEKFNARTLSKNEVPEPVRLGVVDVSFISVTKILPAIKPLLKENGDLIVLVKPQFEAGPKHTKKGIVRDPKIHQEVLERMLYEFEKEGFVPMNMTYSSITGAKGNIEFFAHLRNGDTSNLKWGHVQLLIGRVPISQFRIRAVVEEAHEKLGRQT